MYHSYSSQQVGDTVAAFDRLVIAVESKMPAEKRRSHTSSYTFPHELMDSASILRSSFARSFLTTIRFPAVRFIASGLRLPTTDTHFFPTNTFSFPSNERKIDEVGEDDGCIIQTILMFRDIDDTSGHHITPEKVAGLYTEGIDRRDPDPAEEGSRLFLPYSLGGRGFARMSSCYMETQLEESNMISGDLYRHGAKPLGGSWGRAQRLVKLFQNWTGMVERGLCKLGAEMVIGGI